MTPRKELVTSVGLALAAAMLAVPGAATGAGAAGDERPNWTPRTTGEAASTETVYAVTLLTGDRVLAEMRADGTYDVALDPAVRVGSDPTFETAQVDGDLYVIPSDTAALIGDKLDRELFNVTKLSGYVDPDGVPVIITYDAPPSVSTLRATEDLLAPTVLSSIDAVATTLTADFWPSVTAGSGAEVQLRADGALAGIETIWLDEQVEVALTESVPQIGAPAGWDLGFDGTGQTVAVLDTGIDADHPDLNGKVVAEQNFTSSDTTTDRFGHGTHVAGIVAGTGDAPDGEYVGVAPGAELINAKVLDDAGSGTASGLIAGMEWAAAQGADVMNMSIGTNAPSRGTDPLIEAVDSLTETHDLLFVISAGNLGPGDLTIASPGAADAALTVGAVDKAEQLAGFSSRGPRFGDFAIKPEITAPGVGIVSAGSGEMTTPPPGTERVGDFHLRASGTSMAAPHVAGAAALVLQQEPDLDADALKARLTTTAAPNGALDVYQQGGGRVDVLATLTGPVIVAPAVLDLGHLPYPHGDVEPISAEVTYTNLTDEPVTLDLDVDVRSRQGAIPSETMLSVTPTTLTIDAGGPASATVTLDATTGDVGLYGGYLTASLDGDVTSRVPVGFNKEAENYELTVIGIDRDGQPPRGVSFLNLMDVEDMSRLLQPGHVFVDGVVTVRVPPGTYGLFGAIETLDGHNQYPVSNTFVGDPEVSVTEDTTVVLDARDASRISIDTPEHETQPQGGVSFGYWRTAEQPGPIFGPTWIVRHASREYYALAMDPPTLGGFEFHSRWRLAAPEAELEVTAPVELTLDPILLRAPAVDGEQIVPLVDVGTGAPENYIDVDVEGAAVLARRGPVSYVEQEAHAATAGAAALLITNDVPGRFTGDLGEDGTIPTLSLTKDDGDALRSLLADGDVEVKLDGTVWSPYLYDLVLLEQDGIPDDMSYVIDRDDVVALEVDYHNDSPGHSMEENRSFLRPYHSGSTFLHPSIDGPRERTEYLIAGDDIGYQQIVYGERPFEARLQEQGYTYYERGDTVEKAWFKQILRPALLPEVEPTTRAGDTLTLRLFEWVDAAGNYFPNHIFGLAPYPGDTTETRIWQGDQLVGEIDGSPRGSFPMVEDEAEYRVELDLAREADWWRRSTETHTAWTFTSRRPDGGAEVLPLLSIDYAVDLDLANTAAPPRDLRGRSTLELGVHHQEAGLPAVAGARAWISYNDGDTWRTRSVRPLGDGRFEVVLPGAAPAGRDALSLRVEAWDVDGNRIQQEITRAWHLPTP